MVPIGSISTWGHLNGETSWKSFLGKNNSEGQEKGTYIYYTYQVLLSLLHMLNRLFHLTSHLLNFLKNFQVRELQLSIF